MYRYCRYIEADDCRIAAGGTLSCTSLHGHRIAAQPLYVVSFSKVLVIG